MYFLKIISLVLILLCFRSADGRELKDSLKKIVATTRELQREINLAFKDFKESCNASTDKVSDYEKIVSDFLKENFTLHETLPINRIVNEPLNVSNKTETFMTKLKRKLAELVHRSETTAQPVTRIKRCLAINDSELDGAEISIQKEDNVTASDVEGFQKFLSKLLDCLKSAKTSDGNNLKADEVNSTSSEKEEHPNPPIHDHPFNKSRTENLLRYLTQVQHSVRDTGRPNYKSPDLQKVQTIVDQIKNFDFFDLDGTTEKNGGDSLELLEGEIVKRNVLGDFSDKIKGFVSRKTKKSKSSQLDRKQKRKSNSLFSNVDVVQTDVKYDSPSNEPPVEEESENLEQEVHIVQPTESERLQTDLNTIESKLSPEQQVDISYFLDHISDKPTAFKFDTGPYLLTQMEKLNHPSVDNQEESQDEEIFDGAKKFFDFNSPVKRSLYNNNAEDFQKIAKLKSKLIAEYRDHHPMIDYSAILREIDNKKHQQAEKGDDFIDHFYQLNDGSSGLYDVLKPYHPDKRVMSPFELDLNFKLDSQFKELDEFDTIRDKEKNEPINAESPLYKPETLLEEDEYLSP